MAEDLRAQYEKTLAAILPKEPSSAEADLQYLAQLIDASGDLGETDGLEAALEFAELPRFRATLAPGQESLRLYFVANAWQSLADIEHHRDAQSGWSWEQPDMERSITAFRQSLESPGFEQMLPEYRCFVLTNIGNFFSTIGRSAEAIEYWNRAFLIIPGFGMARCNRAYGISTYAGLLYDIGHQRTMLQYALKELKAGLADQLQLDSRDRFSAIAAGIEDYLRRACGNCECDQLSKEYSLGDNEDETAYRRWCLANRLFLNPLNDLGPYSIAAHDVLGAPSIVVKLDEGPYYPGFFDQMKQEYVSARFLLWEGLTVRAPHFSDREVLLYNTLDYPAYGLGVEKEKAAFRTAYALLDKVAFFVNQYWSLGRKPETVNFRSVWYAAGKKDKGLEPQLFTNQDDSPKRNLPLRGLFWLSKDFFEDDPGYREALDPDARHTCEVRNFLEHKYLKIHEMTPPPRGEMAGMNDPISRSVSRTEFDRMALRIMKLARAALICLSCAVTIEERDRRKNAGSTGTVVSTPLDLYDDGWKC